MKLLLTNDDGIDSPALTPFARALEQLGTVSICVPDRERSWVSKAITRFEPLTVSTHERDGVVIEAVSGYPADAVQIGVFGQGDTPDSLPDLLVSGINLGYNHGTGFMMSSGTVGAAIEGWIASLPSVAVSTGTGSDWHEWRAAVASPEETDAWRRLAAVASEVVADVVASGLGEMADVVSVNMPFESTPDTPRRITTIARVGYTRLFAVTEEGDYVHSYDGSVGRSEGMEGSDIEAAREGCISITPIRLPEAAAVPDDIRAAVER